MKTEEREYLKMMYEEHAEHARLHEELRAGATTILVALISGVLAAIFFFDKNQDYKAGGLIICFISVLGGLLSWKHCERYELHLKVLGGLRKELEKELPKSIVDLAPGLRGEHNKEWPTTHKIRLRWLWLVVYVFTFLVGAYVIVGGNSQHWHEEVQCSSKCQVPAITTVPSNNTK